MYREYWLEPSRVQIISGMAQEGMSWDEYVLHELVPLKMMFLLQVWYPPQCYAQEWLEIETDGILYG